MQTTYIGNWFISFFIWAGNHMVNHQEMTYICQKVKNWLKEEEEKEKEKEKEKEEEEKSFSIVTQLPAAAASFFADCCFVVVIQNVLTWFDLEKL